MAVTLRDVAEATGVSMSTVSRVISDSPRISKETKMKVRKAMNELGYHPNFIARSLVNQSTNVVGVVFPSSGNTAFQNPFFTEVLRAISEGAHDHKYGIQLTTGKTEEEILQDVTAMVQGKRVDGIVMLYTRVDDPIIQFLLNQHFPFVVIGQPPSENEAVTYIDNDNLRASAEATEKLLALGYKRIAFVGTKDNLTVTVTRLAGYKEALKNAGVACDEALIMFDDFSVEGANNVVSTLLNLSEPPDAILAEDDLVALGILKTLNKKGVQIPTDMAILGFNNTFFSELSNPPLSSVDIHIFDLGFQALTQLIKQIKDKSTPHQRILVEHTLIMRDSC